MKIYTRVAVALLAISPFILNAQIDIPASCATPVVDFSGFAGAGFDPNPGPGQLDSDAFATEGFGDNVPFGGSANSGDPARGATDGSGETTGGVYALDAGGNQALWIQPAGSDFTPGKIKMKSCNSSGATIADIELSYDIVYLNDQDRGNSLNFEYSLNDLAYTPVPALDFITPEIADGLGVQTVSRSTTLGGINLADGMCIFFAWVGDDEVGGGSRDEYGLDNITLCASGVAPPPPPPAPNPYCIASDDFDSPQNLISRTITVDMAFMNVGDLWGIANSFSGPPVNTPFSLIDDTNPACLNYFPNDNQGVVPCSYGNQFFGMTDTENPNNMGPVSAEWVFDVSDATNLTAITIDMSAMGDFETSNDNFVWSYSIDGGPFTVIFNMTPDESTSATYTLFDGSTNTLNDPMTVNGTVLLNQMTTFSAPINGAGNQLTLKVEGMGDGGTEAIAWDNITIKGITAGVAVPTMGEWSMFLFALIMLTLGLVFVYNSQQRLALGNGTQVSQAPKSSSLPFDTNTFKSAMKHALGLSVVGFGFIFFVWGEIVPADFAGMALTIPVVAYLIHLVKLFDHK